MLKIPKLKQVKKYYNDLTPAVKATLWLVICNFLTRGFNFVSAPIITRLLPTSEYGIVSIYATYQQLLMILCTFEICLGAYQRGFLEHLDNKKKYSTQIILLSNCITITAFVIVILLRSFYYKYTETDLSVLLLSFLFFILDPAYQCWLYQKRYDYEYKPSVFATLLLSFLRLFTPIVVLFFTERTALIEIRTVLIAQIVFLIPFYLSQVKIHYIWDDISSAIISSKEAILFQLPLIAHSLSYLVLGQADRVMIGEYVGKSEAAIYSVAYSISFVVTIFQTAINQSFKPYRYQKLVKKEYNDIYKTTSLLSVFFAVVVFLFILLAPEIVSILFTEEYKEAIWIIPPVSASTFFMFLYSIYVDIESYYKKTTYIMYVSVICAVLNIFLNYFGINLFGYIACAYSTLICYILFVILHYLFCEKIRREFDITEQFVDLRFLFILSGCLLLLMFISIFTYKQMMIRMIIFFISVIICFFYRSKIIQCLHQMWKKD